MAQKLNYKQIGTVAFKARRTDATNIPGGAYDLVYNTTLYDYGGNYNATTGLFTAPVNGIYKFDAVVNTEAVAVGRAFIQLRGTVTAGTYPNGVARGQERWLDVDSTAERRVNGSWQTYMAAGETIGINVYTAAAMNVADTSTVFSGYLVMKV